MNPLQGVPAPGTEHPAVRHLALEVRMAMADHPGRRLRYVAGTDPISARWRAPDENPAPTSIRPRVLTFTMHRCMAPAVFTGDPFCWEWEVAVDELGRFVASESWRVPLPLGHRWASGQ